MSNHPVISASFRWTQNEFLDAQSMHRDLFVKPKMKVLGFIDIRVFAVFVGCISIARLAINISEAVAFSFENFFLLFLAVIAILLLMQPWLEKRSLIQHFQKRPDRDKMMQFRIDSERVEITMEGVSSGTNSWGAYQKIIRTSKGYLFYPNERIFHWLPNHAFQSKSEIDDLGSMAKKYTPNYSERP